MNQVGLSLTSTSAAMVVEASNTRVRLDVPSSVVLSLLLLTFRRVSIIAWFFFDAASLVNIFSDCREIYFWI